MSFQQEEMSLQRPEESSAPPPCAKGCGFFGTPGTLNMCSVCFKEHLLASGAEPAGAISTAAASEAVARSDMAITCAAGAASAVPVAKAAMVAEAAVSSSADGKVEAKEVWASRCAAEVAKKPFANRCQSCLKKVCLTGFVCRCGKTFCGSHRYAEEHGCTFDFHFQDAGRVDIARDNPLIKREKLHNKI